MDQKQNIICTKIYHVWSSQTHRQNYTIICFAIAGLAGHPNIFIYFASDRMTNMVLFLDPGCPRPAGLSVGTLPVQTHSLQPGTATPQGWQDSAGV